MSSKFLFGLFVEIALALVFSVELSEANCARIVQIGANESVNIHYDYSPNSFYPQRLCRYIFVAPVDYEINAQCHFNLGKIHSSNPCLVVTLDGHREEAGYESICSDAGYWQKKSLFNRLEIEFEYLKAKVSGSASCIVTTIPQSCCECGWHYTPKKIGGDEEYIDVYPFFVSLYHPQNNLIFCGGAIISHRHILSAAHCFTGIYGDATKITAIVGARNWKVENQIPYTYVRHQIDSIKIHANYDAANNYNDIAILFTSTDIEWNPWVGPICLPFLYSNDTFEDRKAYIAGWSATSYEGPEPNELMKTRLIPMPSKKCQTSHSNLASSQLCNESPLRNETCWGDSGGPVIVRLERIYVVGVISGKDACDYNRPGVNTRVTSYLNWIQENTGANFCKRSRTPSIAPWRSNAD